MAKFRSPIQDTALNRARAQGHLNRTGHRFEAFLCSDDEVLWTTVATCCGETEPETVKSWF